MPRFLLIQTAFIGDVVLATPLIESLSEAYPESEIDFVLRNGNENLLEGHPKLRKLFVWNKKESKYKALLNLLKQIRNERYDYVINLQRFASTGFLTAFSRGKIIIGFKKNPFSFLFHQKVRHLFEPGMHEVDRNLNLIKTLVEKPIRQPRLYPSSDDFEKVSPAFAKAYVCMAPSSVWFTKQLPRDQWVALCQRIPENIHLYFLGAPSDAALCEQIISSSGHTEATNLCGKLSFLQSAALMSKARMNYVNDSAPLHFASAMNAPVTAFFCSTLPEFGFGPLSDLSVVAEATEKIPCRPCGVHGRKTCPQNHFDCGYKIDTIKYLPQ